MKTLMYRTQMNRPIFLSNGKARNLSRGGLITYQKGDLVNPDWKNEDTILSMLEEGSLVIPRPIVMSGYLDDYNGKYSCGKMIKDKRKLVPTVVMPDEIIVCSHYTDKVINHLRKKGITLPINEDNYR